MRIAPILSLDELPAADYAYPVCCWEKEDTAFLEPGYFSIPGPVLLLIGPEGGFHEQEMEWIYGNTFRIITLGPHVLRAETAALAAVSIVKYLGGLSRAHGDK
jgi:16S rRNA (uracil1498-N3)-methyltransferase